LKVSFFEFFELPLEDLQLLEGLFHPFARVHLLNVLSIASNVKFECLGNGVETLEKLRCEAPQLFDSIFLDFV